MSTTSYALADSATMIRRSLRHIVRYPGLSVTLVLMPVVFLLLFVYVFGGTLGAGLGVPGGGRTEYVNYVTPGIVMMTIAAAAQGTAISVTMDMTEGIVARFRAMAISRAAVLTGHVVGSLAQTLLGMAVVLGIALLVGFRPNADPVEWLAAAGVLAMISFALIWLAAALGMVAKTVESSSNLPAPLLLLPFLGSGFVPTDTMPAGLRWFAEYQPFTSVIETLRGLLLGTEIGTSWLVATAWSLGIGLLGYLWARSAYERRSLR